MKNLILPVVLLSTLASCNFNANESGKIELQSIKEKKTFLLNIPDSLKFDSSRNYYSQVELSMVYPETIDGKEPTALQHAILKKAFSSEGNLETAIKQYFDDPVGFEDVEGITQEEIEKVPDENTFPSFKSVNVSPVYMGDKTWSYRINEESFFSGAAHGMYGSLYANYDVVSNQEITSDKIFADKETIINLVKGKIASDIKKKQDSCIDLNNVTAIDNFYFGTNSIVFVYNPYEIACYAEGIVTAEIPVYQIENALTPYGKSLLD